MIDEKTRILYNLDGFRLYDLVEIRFFLKQIDKRSSKAVIPDSVWEEAKKKLQFTYSNSTCLTNCLTLISDFEYAYSKKYRSDLEEFIRESKFEDFYPEETGAVYVSTIHKSKGREFDHVYMMLNGIIAQTDEKKRNLYVGMTRAKEALYIHYNNDLFSKFRLAEVEHIDDVRYYSEPDELALQLTHRDVVLDTFKRRKRKIFQLHSGDSLRISGNYLTAEIGNKTEEVVKFSKALISKIQKLEQAGYVPYDARVRFIVAWKGEAEEEETAVLLPNVYFKKITESLSQP